MDRSHLFGWSQEGSEVDGDPVVGSPVVFPEGWEGVCDGFVVYMHHANSRYFDKSSYFKRHSRTPK